MKKCIIQLEAFQNYAKVDLRSGRKKIKTKKNKNA